MSVSSAGSPASVVVDVDDRQSGQAPDAEALGALLGAVLADQLGAGTAVSEVGLALIEPDEMAELNREHMGGTGPTDVLAFPIDGLAPDLVPPGQPLVLGDVVICPDVAAKAPQPLRDELALLVVHGALHLLGHDHAEVREAARMKRLEAELLSRHYHP